jgi:hypothetical protein
MANNIDVKDAAATTKTVKTTDTASVHVPHHNIDTLPALVAGTAVIGKTVPYVNSADVATGNPMPVSDAGGSLTVDSANIGLVAGASSGALVIGTTLTGAGEAHIGQVGGTVKLISVGIAGSTSPAYSTADNVGGKLTFANAARVSAGSGLIQSAIITSKKVQTAAFDLVIFSTDPSNSTFTDNAAQDIHDSDIGTTNIIVGIIHINDGNSFTDASVHQALNQALPFSLPSGTSLYGALVIRGTMTLTTTTDLTIALRILQD